MSFNIDEYVNRAVKEFAADGVDAWGNEKSCILQGLAKLAEAVGKNEYMEMLENKIVENNKEKSIGISAFYAYKKTGNDKYKNIISDLMDLLKNDIDSIDDEMALVFYMKYETIFGGKEHYQDVSNRFKNASYKADKNTAYCMTALIEGIESVDQAIYEYYDLLKRLFKKCLTDELNSEEMDSTEMALAGYSILKACRMKVILAEKYEQLGFELVSDAFEAADSDDMNMGACIMAYAESLLHI